MRLTPHPFAILAAAALAACGLGGCGGSAAPSPAPSARLGAHGGSPGGEIVLTALGAQRIGIATTTVRRPLSAPLPPPAASKSAHRIPTATRAAAATPRSPPARAASRAGVLVPASAIVYDPTGRTLLFISPAPLHYLQRVVHVERFQGGLVLLRHGPSPGTEVVSVGAEELFGVQSGVLAQT